MRIFSFSAHIYYISTNVKLEIMRGTFCLMSVLFYTLLASCNHTEEKNEVSFLENGKAFKLVSKGAMISDTSIKENSSLLGKGKPEPFQNEELPKTYTSRKVIRNLGAFTYDIFYIPGNIVRFNESDSNYVFVTAKSILKDSKLPVVEVLQDEVLYSNKINNQASFNASTLIGGLSVTSDQLMELVVQDVSKSVAPDSLIDMDKLRAYINKVPADKKRNYYFIKSSLLTIVNFKKYSKSDFSSKINTSFVTAEGKVYSSRDKFSKERIVSMDLISFDDILDQIRQQ